jgi:hypothetical protein
MIAEVLREVSALGPFFEISVDPAEEVDPTWARLTDLDPVRLAGLIRGYADRLGTREPRVAASILFQAVAARLWSPVVAAFALGAVPDLSSLHWRWAPGAPIALWLADPAEMTGPDPVLHTVVIGQLRPLLEVFRPVVKVADGLMWGNAASALAGTLRVVRPDLREPVTGLVEELLTREPLAGTGGFVRPGAFLRRSCCLYYRVPPGGFCGDCPLR